MNEIEFKWAEYEEIGTEWNEQLCDKLNNEEYVTLLNDVKDDFNALNQILFAAKLR